jgi:hypothetical protein
MTATAKDPEGRVVNRKPTRSVKNAAEPVRGEPRTLEPTPATPVPTDEATEGSQPMADQPVTDAAEAGEGEVIRTYEDIQITDEEKQRAAAAKKAAMAEEQQMLGRVRGLQTLIEREEQLLSQRLAYAAKIREKGLADNDQKLLDQAERYERAALAEYQKKCQQFERMSVIDNTPERSRRAPTPARSSSRSTQSRR